MVKVLERPSPVDLPPRPAIESFVERLRAHAQVQGTSVAFRYLRNGEEETAILTYGELDAAARRLAGHLQAKGLSGERAMLLFPTSPDALTAILGCLYAGVIAVPMHVSRSRDGCSSLHAIGQDAEVRAALTTCEFLSNRSAGLRPTLESLGVDVVTTETVQHSEHDWTPGEFARDSIAYLQYTSGSTVDPKGVVITHGNLSHNLRALEEIVDECGPHVGVGWLPHFHDMGLVGTFCLPLWMGFPHVFMPPEAFIMKPARWLQAISRYGGTLSPAPSFAYELCVRRVTKEQRETFDLSSWRIAFNGAERINPESMRQFTDSFDDCGFGPNAMYPCYGLAESTLLVTGGDPRHPPIVRRFDHEALSQGRAQIDDSGVSLVSCGRAQGGLDVAVIDSETALPVEEGRIGEIWVFGKSVAAGYWRNDEATEQTFRATLANGAAGDYLRTGDLGFIHDGELFVAGRLKDLIIIAGRNIAPEDVEAAVEGAHAAFVPGGTFAFAIDGMPRERLIVVTEITRSTARGEIENLTAAAREAVTRDLDVMLDEIIPVHQRSLPRTVNGKKRRSTCRDMYLADAIGRRIDD